MPSDDAAAVLFQAPCGRPGLGLRGRVLRSGEFKTMNYAYMKQPDSTAVKSASRTIDIVEQVARRGPVNATELGRLTKIPLSSLSYLLATLVDRGWLYLAKDRTYRIGSALNRLASGAGPTRAERLHRLVTESSRITGETVCLFVRRGHEIEATEVEASLHPLRFIPQEGLRVPLHSFAAGKALLATLDRDAFEAYLAGSKRARFTAATIVDADQLRRDIDATRRRGYARALEEHSAGVVGIAMAIDQSRSISIAIPAPRFDAAVEKLAVKTLADGLRALDASADG
jgi:IclR family transcriptional regulator, acetate operon repressor